VNPLLEQFISESREALQGISEKLMQLENEPGSEQLMTELFRFVHTLKGNSGLFDFPELTRVLHAGEDLMDAVRDGRVAYSLQLADLLLDAMDFVGMLCDEIEKTDSYGAGYVAHSVRLADTLRQMLGAQVSAQEGSSDPDQPQATVSPGTGPGSAELQLLAEIPEPVRMDAYRAAVAGTALHFLAYTPLEECFFQGDDPFYQARQTPGILWGGITARKPWPKLAELDAYSCVLDFHVLSGAPAGEINEYYRYVAEQLRVFPLAPESLILPQGNSEDGPVYDDFVQSTLRLLQDGDLQGVIRAARSMLELCSGELWIASALRWLLLAAELEPDNTATLGAIIASLLSLTPPKWGSAPASDAVAMPGEAAASAAAAGQPADLQPSAAHAETGAAAAVIIAVQREILSLPDGVCWLSGRIKGIAASLQGCLLGTGAAEAIPGLQQATASALEGVSAAPLLSWLNEYLGGAADTASPVAEENLPLVEASVPEKRVAQRSADLEVQAAVPEGDVKFGRRAEDSFSAAKSIKVDQDKIDRLMSLIGEMVVAKNALPYLAGRAESVFGVRELSREIKTQYAVINRIAEEMQDSIMQVRMMPVSFVFQRFPRLVRDTSNKLAKKVNLVLEGEETEADKNIIESLGDPLVHIVRNSLDHGIETPEVRLAAGKPAVGTLVIRASQESDRVIIEIRDDGKGIDPAVIKRKAYEKGLIDEAHLERITDQEAMNLVFTAGFSTKDTVSDLSGRGVGMDVVRTAIEKVNGTVHLESEKGKGTRLRISLPLSMAVTNVMIVESDGQIFGVPMDAVVETVRVPRGQIKTIKKSMATVLRGRIVPLKGLNSLLGSGAGQKANDEEELAVLVVNVGGESVGILVDEFHETVEIILKPMTGVLSGLTAYSGSALLGDGSVLMVLNVKEIV
jgi:two-component system, chemotaxis family, sensor kinase CheA